jgi:hypothetical protein
MALTSAQRKLHRAKMGNFWRDLVIIAFGVVTTLMLVRMGMLEHLLTTSQQQAYIGSFIAGIFFTSIFTIAPASIMLAEMTSVAPPLSVALWGALGAMLGDLLLFLFIRDIFVEDVEGFVHVRKLKKWLTRPHFGFLRWLLPVIGAIIIASPLPDELGLALLGISRTNTAILLPVAFAMNFLGVLAIAVAASQF